MGRPEPGTLILSPRQASFPLKIRAGGSSDIEVFGQIFCQEEYACLRDLPAPKVIFDLGANVGYSSAYLLSCFPSASLIAVEPDRGNFEQCRQNLAPYGERVQLVHGGIWNRRCRLSLDSGGDGREWALQVRESEQGEIAAWDIPSLMAMADADAIDLLKVDIERSEIAVFDRDCLPWLRKVRNICIELHGADCEAAFNKAMKGFACRRSVSGELTICRDIEPLKIT